MAVSDEVVSGQTIADRNFYKRVQNIKSHLIQAQRDWAANRGRREVVYRFPGGGWSTSPVREFEGVIQTGRPCGVMVELAKSSIAILDLGDDFELPLVEASRAIQAQKK